MLANLELGRATSILELACGAGDVTTQIADRMPPDARLVASDFSPEMVEAAKAHAAAKGLTNVDFEVLDAQRLDVADESVDRVACRFGYMLMPEPEKAFAETYRVLQPGGRVVAAVWGALERNAWLMVFGMALMQCGIGSEDDDPFGPGGVFSLADPSVLRTKLEDAGFGSVKVEEIVFTYDFDDFDAYWAMQSRIAGGASLHLQTLPEDRQLEIKETARSIAESFVNASGYSAPSLALGVIGHK
jgi:SAM-dependent methyltransferase